MANYSFSRGHAIEAHIVGGTKAGISAATACACGMSGGIDAQGTAYNGAGQTRNSNEATR